MVAHITQI